MNLKRPIIQAPMAGVQGVELAVAVSNAGGLGSLPAAMLSAEALEQALSQLSADTKGPYNVNFFCHSLPADDKSLAPTWLQALQPYMDELGVELESIKAGATRRPFNHDTCAVVEAYRPAVVSFHFGLPEPSLLQRVKAAGCAVIASATTVDEAIWLQANGADAVIAQGLEAGGHRGHFLTTDTSQQLGTFALLPQVIDAIELPVIAAGAIVSHAGVRAVLALGASAAQIGTAFLLCDECTTSGVHRRALVSREAQHTVLTNLFSGGLARGIVNRVIRELGPVSAATPPFPQAATAITALRTAAEANDSGDFSPLWCGQNAAGCAAIPAALMLDRLFPV